MIILLYFTFEICLTSVIFKHPNCMFIRLYHLKFKWFYIKNFKYKSILIWYHSLLNFVLVNPYWQHFGTVTECHFRKQNPENFFIVTILVTSYIEHLKSCYHISKQQGVFYLYHKYFKHVTSSSAEICVGFFFQGWRSWIFPVFGFFFPRFTDRG